MHRKADAAQRVSASMMVLIGAVAVVVAALAFAGLFTTSFSYDSGSVAEASAPPSHSVPEQSPMEAQQAAPTTVAPEPFPTDDRGFIDSSARCRGSQPAYAIGRTEGSLVVICGERGGQYEYLGVRLSDSAVLRTNAKTDSTRTFVAQKAGVLYAVSATELKVTAGSTVIKQEPMIEYREMVR